MIHRLLLIITCCFCAQGCAAEPELPASAGFDLARPDITAFVDQQVKAGADRQQTVATLSKAAPQPKIIDIITRPAEKSLSWSEYRARFLTDDRIAAGVQLWTTQRVLLEDIARQYRVSPQYLLAILGVETFYGRTTGRYRVLDALATLAFDYPPRSGFFRDELGQFLLLVREERLDPETPLGSYAGAMGIPQFMPSSYRRYAVNADDGPNRDLWNDWADVFASVANYLQQHGWQYGGAVLADVRYSGSDAPAVAETMALNETLGALRKRGFEIDSGAADDTPALLVDAPLADRANYRAGFQNFYVITRYNRSPLYAMAVNDLAEAILSRYRHGVSP